MGCEHEKRRFVIEATACPVCDPVRVQTLEALEQVVRMEASVEEMVELVGDARALEAVKAMRELTRPVVVRRLELEVLGGLPTASEFLEEHDGEDLELHTPPTEARCRCCNRRLTDRQSIGAGEGPLCREGLCRKKAG